MALLLLPLALIIFVLFAAAGRPSSAQEFLTQTRYLEPGCAGPAYWTEGKNTKCIKDFASNTHYFWGCNASAATWIKYRCSSLANCQSQTGCSVDDQGSLGCTSVTNPVSNGVQSSSWTCGAALPEVTDMFSYTEWYVPNCPAKTVDNVYLMRGTRTGECVNVNSLVVEKWTCPAGDSDANYGAVVVDRCSSNQCDDCNPVQQYAIVGCDDIASSFGDEPGVSALNECRGARATEGSTGTPTAPAPLLLVLLGMGAALMLSLH